MTLLEKCGSDIQIVSVAFNYALTCLCIPKKEIEDLEVVYYDRNENRIAGKSGVFSFATMNTKEDMTGEEFMLLLRNNEAVWYGRYKKIFLWHIPSIDCVLIDYQDDGVIVINMNTGEEYVEIGETKQVEDYYNGKKIYGLSQALYYKNIIGD